MSVILNRNTAWNPGGGNWLELVPVAFVQSYSRASAGAVPTVTLQPGREWLLINTTPGTLQYKEDAGISDSGTLYSIEIKGSSYGESLARRTLIESVFGYTKMLVRFRDYARLSRLVGTPTEPLELTYSLATDADPTGSRGYTLTLKGTLTQAPAYE